MRALSLLALGCRPEPADPQQLLDPATCSECHPDHYREWSGSMHAYATDDPVFAAMNARGQRETDGALGDFCVNCHAPMAVRMGATSDGLDLDAIPSSMRGVTCAYCHLVESVDGAHDNPLILASDGVMRGGIRTPADNDFHASSYSPLLDRDELASAELCGSCHDIVNDHGVRLERTYLEWLVSVFAADVLGGELTCAECHMPKRRGPASTEAEIERDLHSHAMPGVDVALTPWPETDTQRALIESELSSVLLAQLCVEEGQATVLLENIAAGHSWPSGAAQDRRAWVELVAWQGDQVLYQSGAARDDQSLDQLDDPDLWQFRDRIFDEDGQETHMFWEARSFDSALLEARSADDPLSTQTHQTRTWPLPGQPDRVTLRVRLRPMGVEVLEDLVTSGDLDPQIIAEMPVFDLAGTVLEWKAEGGPGCTPAF